MSFDAPTARDDDPRWPVVSAVVVTRGRPELVRRAVASVVAQTYPGRLECIVVHDQEPPEASLTELSAPRRSVTVLTNTHRPGLAGARNTGLDHAVGSTVAMLDDDDAWLPAKTERQLQLLTEQPDLLAVGSGIRLRFPERIVDWPARATRFDRKVILRSRVKELHSSTLLMRRDAFAKAGRYDEELPFGYAEDYDFILRLVRVGRVGAVTEPLAEISKDVQSWYKGRADRTARGLRELLAKHPELSESARGHARILAQLGFATSAAGDRPAGWRLGSRALLRWPLSPHAYLTLAQAATGVDPATVARMLRRLGRGTA